MKGQVLTPSEQDRFVRDLVQRYEYEPCSARTMDQIRPHAHRLDMATFTQMQAEKFYSPEVAKASRCLIGSLALPDTKFRGLQPSQRLLSVLNETRRLGEGINGLASILGREPGEPLGLLPTSRGGKFMDPGEGTPLDGIIMKMNFNSESSEPHREYVIGTLLNSLRDQVPYFAQVYGLIQCDSVVNKNIVCTHPGSNPLLLMEKIKGQEFTSWFQDHASDLTYTQDLILIYFQILYAILLAYLHHGFVHNDLHTSNVMIHTLEQPIYLPIRIQNDVYMIYTRYLPVLIDYGYSRVILRTDEQILRNLHIQPDPAYQRDGTVSISIGTDVFYPWYPSSQWNHLFSTITPFSAYSITDIYSITRGIDLFLRGLNPPTGETQKASTFFTSLLQRLPPNIFSRESRQLTLNEAMSLQPFSYDFFEFTFSTLKQIPGVLIQDPSGILPGSQVNLCSETIHGFLQGDPHWSEWTRTAEQTCQVQRNHIISQWIGSVDPPRTTNLPLLLDSLELSSYTFESVDPQVLNEALRISWAYVQKDSTKMIHKLRSRSITVETAPEWIHVAENLYGLLNSMKLHLNALYYVKNKINKGKSVHEYKGKQIEFQQAIRQLRIMVEDYIRSIRQVVPETQRRALEYRAHRLYEELRSKDTRN